MYLRKAKLLGEHGYSTVGQIKGNNRQIRYWSPEARNALLKQRVWELEAFAQDRRLDTGLLIGIAEAVMRLGRVPDLSHYGLDYDDSRAVTHFMADVFLNIEDEEQEGENVEEAKEGNLEETDGITTDMGPYLKFFHKVLTKTNRPAQKMFDLPSKHEQDPDDELLKTPGGIGVHNSVFNTDGVKPAFMFPHTLGGKGMESPLNKFRNKARQFRRNLSGE